MKTKILPFLAFITTICFNSNAQTNCNALFQKNYSNNDTSLTPSQIIANNDESFVVVGSSTVRGDVDGHVYAFVSKIDKDGFVLWSKHYVVDGKNCYFNNVRTTSDGGYICIGGIDVYRQGYHKSWLVKLDAAGNVVWNKEYEDGIGNTGSNYLGFKDIRPTGNDGFAIIADLNMESFVTGIVLIKTNASGDIQWSNYYILDSEYSNANPRGIIVDGNVITVSIQGPSNRVLQVNKNTGQFIWMKTFQFPNETVYPFYSMQEIYKSGTNYILSITKSAKSVYDQAVFYINKNGQPLQALKITENLGPKNVSIIDATAIPTHDGGFITSKILKGSTTNTYINKFNAKGKVEWNKGLTSLTTTLLKEMPDSGFVSLITGLNISTSSGFRVIRMDKAGNTGGCVNPGIGVTTEKIACQAIDVAPASAASYQMQVSTNTINALSIGIPVQTNLCYTSCTSLVKSAASVENAVLNDTNVKLYPNPADNFIYVTFKSVTASKYTASIIDITGKVVKHVNGKSIAGTNIITTGLKELPKGNYVIRIVNGSNGIVLSKFVKQ